MSASRTAQPSKAEQRRIQIENQKVIDKAGTKVLFCFLPEYKEAMGTSIGIDNAVAIELLKRIKASNASMLEKVGIKRSSRGQKNDIHRYRIILSDPEKYKQAWKQAQTMQKEKSLRQLLVGLSQGATSAVESAESGPNAASKFLFEFPQNPALDGPALVNLMDKQTETASNPAASNPTVMCHGRVPNNTVVITGRLSAVTSNGSISSVGTLFSPSRVPTATVTEHAERPPQFLLPQPVPMRAEAYHNGFPFLRSNGDSFNPFVGQHNRERLPSLMSFLPK